MFFKLGEEIPLYGNPESLKSENSGFGKDFNVGTGYVHDTLKVDGVKLLFRFRADDDSRIGEHLNDELIFDKEGRSKPILINNHLPFKWKGENDK